MDSRRKDVTTDTSANTNDSTSSKGSTLQERINNRVNEDKGMNEVLKPDDYIERGLKILAQSAEALAKTPLQNTSYSPWKYRYIRVCYEEDDTPPSEFSAFKDDNLLTGEDIRRLLAHLDIKFDADVKWTYVTYASKGAVEKFEEQNKNSGINRKLEEVDMTLIALVSKSLGAIIALDCHSKADISEAKGDLFERLPNSELLFQTWADQHQHPSTIRDLRYIMTFPIANAGTLITIKDVFRAKRIQSIKRDAGEKVTITPNDSNYVGILANLWGGLAGTRNGQPVPYMLADHAALLGGKELVKIHAWYRIPLQPKFGALIFELGWKKVEATST